MNIGIIVILVSLLLIWLIWRGEFAGRVRYLRAYMKPQEHRLIRARFSYAEIDFLLRYSILYSIVTGVPAHLALKRKINRMERNTRSMGLVLAKKYMMDEIIAEFDPPYLGGFL